MRLRKTLRAPVTMALALLVAGATLLHPAPAGAAGWSFMVGGSSSWFGGDASDFVSDPYRAISAGFGPRFALGAAWSIEPQLWWISKGGEGSVEFRTSTGGFTEQTRFDFTWRAHYVELPVLLRWDVGGGGVRTHLGAGGTVAYRVSDASELTIVDHLTVENPPIGAPQRLMQGASIFEGAGTLHGDPPFNDWDAGLAMAAGVSFGGPGPRVALDVRYFHGLTNILPSALDGRNRTLLAAVGLEW